MRLLLTRHPAQAAALDRGLIAHLSQQFTLGYLPLTVQVLPEDLSDLQDTARLVESGGADCLVFTSANTVRALLAAGWNGTVPQHTQVAAVGPGTASVVRELTEIRDIWMPSRYHGAALAAELPPPQTPDRRQLVLPQSARAAPEVAQTLTRTGWSVHHVNAYDTVPYAHVLAEATDGPARMPVLPEISPPPAEPAVQPEGQMPVVQMAEIRAGDVVIITSSSAAEQWVDRAAERTTTVPVWAVGEPTAQTLNRRGAPADAVLGTPTAEAVLQKLTHSH